MDFKSTCVDEGITIVLRTKLLARMEEVLCGFAGYFSTPLSV